MNLAEKYWQLPSTCQTQQSSTIVVLNLVANSSSDIFLTLPYYELYVLTWKNRFANEEIPFPQNTMCAFSKKNP